MGIIPRPVLDLFFRELIDFTSGQTQ